MELSHVTRSVGSDMRGLARSRTKGLLRMGRRVRRLVRTGVLVQRLVRASARARATIREHPVRSTVVGLSAGLAAKALLGRSRQ